MRARSITVVKLPFDKMKPGDVIAYEGKPRAVILRTNAAQDQTDQFGRKLQGHWCRTLDSEAREGFIYFGPGGVGPVEVSKS